MKPTGVTDAALAAERESLVEEITAPSFSRRGHDESGNVTVLSLDVPTARVDSSKTSA